VHSFGFSQFFLFKNATFPPKVQHLTNIVVGGRETLTNVAVRALTRKGGLAIDRSTKREYKAFRLGQENLFVFSDLRVASQSPLDRTASKIIILKLLHLFRNLPKQEDFQGVVKIQTQFMEM
jgi:hypothetical protein